MIHDPLCRNAFQEYKYDDTCYDCKLISAAYKRGYEDAMEEKNG